MARIAEPDLTRVNEVRLRRLQPAVDQYEITLAGQPMQDCSIMLTRSIDASADRAFVGTVKVRRGVVAGETIEPGEYVVLVTDVSGRGILSGRLSFGERSHVPLDHLDRID